MTWPHQFARVMAPSGFTGRLQFFPAILTIAISFPDFAGFAATVPLFSVA
jgi:hypothetical protein